VSDRQTAHLDPEQLLDMMRKRRVVRDFVDKPVPDDVLAKITEAGRWATSGGMRYPHRFMVVRDPLTINNVRSASPGMIPVPPALIVIMIETEQANRDLMQVEPWMIHWIDVGTAAMSMTTMAQALGLGSCPVTSFSKRAVSAVLDLPPNLSPEFILILGYPAPVERVKNPNAPKPVTTRDLTYWERAGTHDPVPVNSKAANS
jgi:nitroreductase